MKLIVFNLRQFIGCCWIANGAKTPPGYIIVEFIPTSPPLVEIRRLWIEILHTVTLWHGLMEEKLSSPEGLFISQFRQRLILKMYAQLSLPC